MQGFELGFLSMVSRIKKVASGVALSARQSFAAGLNDGMAGDLARSTMPIKAMLGLGAPGAGYGSTPSYAEGPKTVHVYGDVNLQGTSGPSVFQELLDLE